jgi:Fe-S-cluster containining protein
MNASANASANASPSEALCVRCGFCCDGALFGHVPVHDDEAAALPAPLVAVERAGKKTRLAFLQPCAAFRAQCTVYDARPKVCRTYRCELLKAVEAGERTLEEAHAIVARVQERRTDIERRVGEPFELAKRSLVLNAGRDVDAFLTLLAVEKDLDAHFRKHADEGDGG